MDIWTGICQSLSATLQDGHLGCTVKVYGVVGSQVCGKVLSFDGVFESRVETLFPSL